jgi:molybdate transport system substrate-binding protein
MRTRIYKKHAAAAILAGVLAAAVTGCSSPASQASSKSTASESAAGTSQEADVELQVFIAASLNTVMTEIADQYQSEHPNVKITYNADSSGKLMTQIKEGYQCDLFFSAAQKQMDELEEGGFVVDGTRKNVVNNQLVVLTYKNSGTKVTDLTNLKDAKSLAIADGSVPAGRYTREALINLGILEKTDDPSNVSTMELSEALGSVSISEQSNVSKVLQAVREQSCEVGTTYYSDTYGMEDEVEVLQKVPYDLTGNIIYPIAQIQNEDADEAEQKAAQDFEDFVTSKSAKEIFEKYYFDPDVPEE